MKENKVTTTHEVNEITTILTNAATQLDDDRFMPFDEEGYNKSVELIEALRVSNKLKSEIRQIENMSREEIKMLIKLYYQMQDTRKALREQIRSIEDDESKKINVKVLDWCLDDFMIIEKGINDILKTVCEQSEVGRWLLQIVGIGPVLAAGCLAYFDIEGKEYASQFISYAGLNDNNRKFLGRVGVEKIANDLGWKDKKTITNDDAVEFAAKTQWKYDYLRCNAYDAEKDKWSKTKLIAAASKIPYNADLKCLMWKIGKSFNWQCNKDASLYGRLFSERRVKETINNDKGLYADQAAEILATKNIGKGTEAYKAYSVGKLPKAHINARALRWVEKLFISHLFEEMYRVHNKKAPDTKYYPLDKDPMHNKYIGPEVPFTKVPGEE